MQAAETAENNNHMELETTTKECEEDPPCIGGVTASRPSGRSSLYHLTTRTGELFVLSLILIAWILSVSVFLHRWRHLRILPPRALLFKDTTPMNLDRVKVIDCTADSVIYRGYPRRIASTLQARFNGLKRTFSKRITNLPIAMVSVRRRPSLGRPSFYGRPSHDGRQSSCGRPSHVGPHRISTFYRAPRWSRTTELEPEVMQPIPEVMQAIPEMMQSITEVMQSTSEVPISESEVARSTPEEMKCKMETAIFIPEAEINRPEVWHPRTEGIASLAEVVIEFAHCTPSHLT